MINRKTLNFLDKTILKHMKTTDIAAPDWKPLDKLQTILVQLETGQITYCHWKSNYHLNYALTGKEDVDVLVAFQDFSAFVEILMANGFKVAESITSKKQPGVFHFLGNDDATGTLINIHTFSWILTGDHFLKSWNFPFADMLLAETRSMHGVKIPVASSELIVFVIRHMIKQTTPVDFYMGMKHVQDNKEEYQWLTHELDIDASVSKLNQYFPEISPADFHAARELLIQDGRWMKKILLGLKFRRALGKYQRFGLIEQYLMTLIALTKMAFNKFAKKQKHMHMQTGGKIIAFVGPQATGKSTLTSALQAWLGQELSVQCIHAGKPPSTLLTWLPNNLIPLARKIFTGYATVKIEKAAEDNQQHDFPLIFIVRKVILAHDRRSLLRKAYRQSRNGMIVISDRYPSDEIGAIDGATFRDESINQQRFVVKRLLMRLERKIYRDICPPDLVLQLTVSVEKAVLRNQIRDKEGDQTTEYVQMRHTMKYIPRFDHCPVIEISTDRDFQETLVDAKQHVWKHL